MYKSRITSRSSAFFSFDAALALAVAVFSFALFSAMLAASAASASQGAHDTSGSLLSLRFSSYVLEQAAQVGFPAQAGSHYSASELDLARLGKIDLQQLLEDSGKEYASISLRGKGGQLFFAEAGESGQEKYCSSRLALLFGEIVKLEACIA